MKKLLLLFLFLLALPVGMRAQQTLRPFEGTFISKEPEVELHLNLYEETVEVPGSEFLGKMYGYMSGRGIYGTWMLLSQKVKGNKATLRFSNDIGSDVQNAELVLQPDSTYTFSTTGTNALRRAQGRKLVKVTGNMLFRRK